MAGGYGFNDEKQKRNIIDEMTPTINDLRSQINALQTRVNGMQTTVNSVQSTVDTMQRTVASLQTKTNNTQTNLNNYWKTIYPVGSIYMSVSATNPGSIIGGTWVLWGSGRVPVCVNGNDSDFNTVEKTGGEKKHTLTVNEIPPHWHMIRVMSEGDSDPDWDKDNYVKAGANSQEAGAYTESAGSGYSHNNLQPYITCYMWKRTA